jgi:tetratricopeptide (TPR) repeat protein
MFIIGGKEKDFNKILKHVDDLEAKGNITGAIKELEKAIDINPKDGNIYKRLGDLYLKDKKVKESIEAYKKGVEAYRADNFLKNAVAICKKILRCDPNNMEIDLVAARLLADLEEKRNAIAYYFEYIKKHLEVYHRKEVLNTLEEIRRLGIVDKDVVSKVHDAYKKVGREDLAKRYVESLTWKQPVPVIRKKPEEAKPIEKVVIETVKPSTEEIKLKEDITRLDDVVKGIESIITQLRKADRLGDVINALDKSLTTMSDAQKQSLESLQRSLRLNIDSLQISVKDLQQSSAENIKELKPLFDNLQRTLENLRNQQTTLTHKMDESLKSVSNSFNSTTKDAFEEIKNVLSVYQKATDDMCLKLGETKDSNISLLKVSEGIKAGIHKMDDTLIKYILGQELKEKKQTRYILIIIGITAAICSLLVFSILR